MSDTPEQPIGSTLDNLGITADIAPDTLIASAIVVMRTVLADGTERLSIAHSAGIGGVETAGMLHLAATMSAQQITGVRTQGA